MSRTLVCVTIVSVSRMALEIAPVLTSAEPVARDTILFSTGLQFQLHLHLPLPLETAMVSLNPELVLPESISHFLLLSSPQDSSRHHMAGDLKVVRAMMDTGAAVSLITARVNVSQVQVLARNWLACITDSASIMTT